MITERKVAQPNPNVDGHDASMAVDQPMHPWSPWFLCQDFLGHSTHANLLQHYLGLESECDYRLERFSVAQVGNPLARRILRLGGARLPLRPVASRGVDIWAARMFLVQGYLARQAMTAIESWDADIVYLHSHSAGLAVVNLPDRVPVVLSLDSTLAAEARMLGRRAGIVDRPALSMERRILDRADLIVSFSTWARDSVVNDIGIDPGKVTVIRNGVQRLPPATPDPAIDFPDDLPIAGFVGNDLERKGGNLLLEAHQRHLADRVRLVMVTRQPIDTGKFRNVTVLRNLSRETLLASVLPRFTLLAHPAAVDWSPYAVVEAIACGLPVVASNVGALPEMVTDGENGYLLTKLDPGRLAEAIAAIVDHPARRCAMGRSSHDLFARVYDAGLTYPELLKSLRKMASGHASGDEFQS